MPQDSVSDEVLSKRLEKFRCALATAVPVFPNDQKSRVAHQAKSLPQLMLDYVNWRARYVSVRPRKVEIAETVLICEAWESDRDQIENFLDKVRQGGDILAHLSRQPRTRGVDLKPWKPGDSKWRDKDFALTTKGYHHFHIGDDPKKDFRSKNVVFGQVTRETFTVVAVLDHSVFTLGSKASLILSKIHDHHASKDLEPGAVYITHPITTSGHSLHHRSYVNRCKEFLIHLDPKLDSIADVQCLLADDAPNLPPSLQLEWHFNHLDLALFDQRNNVYLLVQAGWN